MSTTEQLARFETAQETLGMLVAIRTSLVYSEKRKAKPDVNKITIWESEIAKYNDEDLSLRFSDTTEIERILTSYGPMVKANSVNA
jgi:hypothetical protein